MRKVSDAIHSEWFWSQQSANSSAIRLRSKGYEVTVTYERTVDGRMTWILRAY